MEAAKLHGKASWLEIGQLEKAGKLKAPTEKLGKEALEIGKSMLQSL